MAFRRHGFADRPEVMSHGFGIGMRKHDPGRAVLRRTECPKKVSRFGLLLTHHAGSCSLARPQPGLRPALTDPHFILKPDIDLVRGDVRRHDRLDLERERFF